MKRFAVRRDCSSGQGLWRKTVKGYSSWVPSLLAGVRVGVGQTLLLLSPLTLLQNPHSLGLRETVPPPVTCHNWEGRGKSRAGNPSQATISGPNGTLPARPIVHPTPSVLLRKPLSLRPQLVMKINPSHTLTPNPGILPPSNSPLGRHDWQEYHRRWCHKERGQRALLDHLSLQPTRLHRQIDLQRFRLPARPALHTERSLVTQ